MLSEFVNKLTGLPVDACDAFVSLFIAIPIGAIYNKLFSYIEINTKIPKNQQRFYRCLYSIITTLYLMWMYLDWFGIANILLSIIITYGLIKIFKPSFKLSVVVFVINIIHLLFCHIHRQFETVEKFDFTSPFMCLVIKLTLYAWSRYDGTQKEEDLFNAYQKKACIKKEPTFFEFLAYTLFFPGFFTGPACDYYEFEEILNKSYAEEKEKEGQMDAVKSKLLKGLIYTVIYVSFGGFTYQYLISEEGLSKPFLYRLIYLTITSVAHRFKFYLAWTLAEASYNLIGIGYNGVSKGKPLWNGIINASIKLELSENMNSMVNHWNIRTTLWLRHTIYDRINKYLGKTSSLIGIYVVDITSAIWHGTYSGYFLAFVSVASYNTIVKSFRKSVSPFIHEKHAPLHKFKPIYDILGIIVTQCIMNFTFAPFILLTIGDSIKLWKSFYFFVIIIMFIAFLILKPLGLEKYLFQKQIEILKINPYKKHSKPIKSETSATINPSNEENEKIAAESSKEKEELVKNESSSLLENTENTMNLETKKTE
ncbi:MBOAT-domain-containing protein [Piromyces finnis]|uniref:MBOAT-domain-containing protein n=1 Tax=Piromyces finnis TaxID=1754191 RepID=A0A1Y1V9T9_9FUNG|nr:MBOAT-domain-containing protein [Piromyces finnis]|eukprot:ORX50422.1 MBOAT-domain-containing protein [Piromyces finnis]